MTAAKAHTHELKKRYDNKHANEARTLYRKRERKREVREVVTGCYYLLERLRWHTDVAPLRCYSVNVNHLAKKETSN